MQYYKMCINNDGNTVYIAIFISLIIEGRVLSEVGCMTLGFKPKTPDLPLVM